MHEASRSNAILGASLTLDEARALADFQQFRQFAENADYRRAWGEVERIMEASAEADREWTYARAVVTTKVKATGLLDPDALFAERAIEGAVVCYILRGGLTGDSGRWLMAPWRHVKGDRRAAVS